MIVRRDGVDYNVLPLDDEWQFWQARFTGAWEAGTKAVIDEHVDGGTYVDLGAWVGPTVLWAAPRARHVIAVEPDPVAYQHLQFNTTANGHSNVTCHRVGLGRPGKGFIRPYREFGDSQSSTIRGGHGRPIDLVSLESVIGDAADVQLIKMDIEGAEGEVIPREADYLRELGAPLLLSMHPAAWLTDPTPYLEGWKVETVGEHEALFTP